MNDLISRQSVKNWLAKWEGYIDHDLIARMQCRVIDIPSAQPKRNPGKWIYVRGEEAGNALYMCSECGKGDIHAPEVKVSYCWNCGAEMRGAEDE